MNALTPKQAERAARSGITEAKRWAVDTTKTGREWDAMRVYRIAAQDARYTYDSNPGKQVEHAEIFAERFTITLRDLGTLSMDQWLEITGKVA